MTPVEVDRLFDSILSLNENKLNSKLSVFFRKLKARVLIQWQSQGLAAAEAIIQKSQVDLEEILLGAYLMAGTSGGKFTIDQLNDGEEDAEDFPEEALLVLLLLWGKSESAFISGAVTGTTLDIFREVIIDAQAEGSIDPGTIKDVVEQFGKRNQNRTKTISTTEAGKGISKGQHEVGVELQKKVIFHKSWRSQRDLNVRDTHVRANARYAKEPIKISELFEVGAGRGLYPRASTLPLEEIIRCRCYTLLKKQKRI